ncbi:phosphoribosylamine--glycine ligase [Oscillochloris sp. ZM17-4]|uniref:phosphoribosylamine--glycine ligase n=1 Tax=Oscillochloris sp. ZM17-4 TaxID=2866714 RepID=UPI001C73B5FC|nr:phosphoribosylamine--glycine ligase [Oscillochloris sp. ZM17-4]
MKILVLGSDGRTHAMVWKLFSSPSADVLCTPGNGGAVLLAPQVELDLANPAEVARWAFAEQIDLIVPAESGSLWAGMVDEVVAMHIGVFGASQRSTRLEWSRCYAKEFLQRYGLPTARGRAFTSLPTAEKFLAAQSLPVVLKADHPAGGGGTYTDRYTALEALRGLFINRPIEGSSNGVVIEEYLPGITVSFSAIVDGSTALPLLPARIYDRLNAAPDSPQAPGMGAITGNSSYARRLGEHLHRHLITPIIAALAKESLPYWGILGVDCVITDQGPRISDLRCSLRDMEAQVVLPRLEDDLLPLIEAAISRRLHQLPPLRWRDEASVGISLVAQGYPNHFAIGGAVRGLSELDEGVLVFHDQTHNPVGMRYTPATRGGPGMLSSLIMGSHAVAPDITLTGGHVLTVVCLGATLNGARGRALLNAERISFPGRTYREDVGSHEFR